MNTCDEQIPTINANFQNKCEKIDDAYNQKEKDLRLHFQKLEKDLN